MFRLIAAAFLTASAVATSAAPPSAAAASANDPQRLSAARKLLQVMNYDANIDRTVDTLIKQIQNDLPAQMETAFGQALPADVITRLQGVVEVHFRKAIADHREDLRRATLLIYAKHFTTAELSRLAEIQRDPVMAKYQQEMPEIAAESLKLGRALTGTEIPKIQEEAKAILEEYVASRAAPNGT